MKRREFLFLPAAAALPAADFKQRIGLVHSTHSKLARPSSGDDPLDYERVRDMVWKAIEYGKPRAGSLEAKIKPGSWVVIKPNIVFLRPQSSYTTGDVTDMRVTRAVLEYVARKSRAARITIAEGGSYRGIKDPEDAPVVMQDGKRVDASTFDWGPDEFSGTGGSLNDMLADFAKQFPDKKFDYVDLNYDALRDASGNIKRLEVPKTPKGVGAFGERSDYGIARTIVECDFLISVPVAKVHARCGITCCMKNFVGAAPREVYAEKRGFANAVLHREHSLEGRIDSFITDLASFHPPDYNVVDCIRGLQYAEHRTGQRGQMIRSNMILAGENTVAVDAMVARMLGFNPWDMEFLHMAQQRDMGSLDLNTIDVIGDDPGKFERRWGKPRDWYGRCNREWRVTGNPETAPASWTRHTARTDTLDFAKVVGGLEPGKTYAAAVRVISPGTRKGFLWAGVSGKLTASLNGQTVMEEQSVTRYRVAQFRAPLELRSGENLLVLRVTAISNAARVSVLITGERNDGDTMEGIRWLA
ncbi:MAG TPA: DUF362 domain-containing protein [Bryobacteraceae bacterium]|nr:DUF362 domain-containing protein [Bryobacteraceae bacterium]HPU70954.1 DUF362 domain-containing protein [Bryobacteraceae bacterium]